MRIVFIISFIASITVMGLHTLAEGTSHIETNNSRIEMALEAAK